MGARSSQSRGPGLNKSDGHLLEYFRKTFSGGGGGTNHTPVVSGHTATGGVISDYTTPPGDVFRAHVFTSSGTFDVTEIGDYGSTVDYLVVGGGGGGGCDNAGGGGGGGLRSSVDQTGGGGSLESALPISTSPGSYTVTIGAGGGAGIEATQRGGDGGPTRFGSIVS